MTVTIRQGDCREVLRTMPDSSVHCVVTSPPYFGLRDYGHAGQIGLEATPDAYVAEMVAVFRDVRRVLRDDATLWLNLGDSYVASPRGNKPGDISTSSLTNPKRQDTMPRRVADAGSKQATNQSSDFDSPLRRLISAGLKQKDLIGIPWRVAFALQADGWYLRQDIIWSKPNPMPESVTDRCTKAHEYIFLMSKSARYRYDAGAIAELAVAPGVRMATPYAQNAVGSQSTTPYNGNPKETRNKRSVWEVTTQPFSEAHFATFPPDLIEPCIKAGCPEGGTVLDPFFGAGTTGLVADRLGRNCIGIELNETYAAMAERRIRGDAGMLADVNMIAEASAP